MKIAIYSIRGLLFLQFIYAGAEKLFLPFNQTAFLANPKVSKDFATFYLLLSSTGFLLFVGLMQLCCAILLLFNRTYLLGAVMLVPLVLCLIATHLFISKDMGHLLYDGLLLLLTGFLMWPHFTLLTHTFFYPH